MSDNGPMIEAIVQRLAPYAKGGPDAVAPLDQIRSALQLLDQFAGDDAGRQLGLMLGSVDRAIVGLESGDAETALAEADQWGVGHLVRAALQKAEADAKSPKRQQR